MSVRMLLIGVAAVLLVGVGLFAYQSFGHRSAQPADASKLAQAEAACLSNTKSADQATVDAGMKGAKNEAHATASLGATDSQERGANHALAGPDQLAENDEIRKCIASYLQRR